MGTTNDQALVFQTNSVERMKIMPNGIITASNTVSLYDANELRFYNSGNTNYSSFKAQAQDVDINYTLPPTDGDENSVLSTDASGGLFWQEMGDLGSNLRYNVLEVINQASYDLPDTVSHILVDRNGVSRINLLSGDEYVGKVIFIKRLSNGPQDDVEICPDSGEFLENFDVDTGIVLGAEMESLRLIYDGNTWWIMTAYFDNSNIETCDCTD